VRSEAVDVLLSCRLVLLPAAAARWVYPGHGNCMPHHQSCQPAHVLPWTTLLETLIQYAS